MRHPSRNSVIRDVAVKQRLRLTASGGKTRPDYSGYQDIRKHGLIATILELRSRAVECVAR
jgi:hypothetical protein